MYNKIMMLYEWDENKNQKNIKKHGFDFIDADFVFNNPHFIYQNLRKDYGETRFVVIGQIEEIIVVLVYTERGVKKRIISLRRAKDHERKTFKNRLE